MSESTEKLFDFQKLAYSVCIILFTGFVLGYLIPSLISYNTLGYTEQHLLGRIQNTKIDSSTQSVFVTRDAQVRAIDSIIRRLKNVSDTVPVGTKLTRIKDYQLLREKVNEEPNIRLIGFADSRISLVWPILLSAILIVCFVLLPFSIKIDWFKFFVLFFIVFAIMFIPNQIRNSKLGSDGRVIFSVFNGDINPLMFYYQLFLYLIILAVLVFIWLKCEYAAKQAAQYVFDENTFDGIVSDLANVKAEYHLWQAFSLAIFTLFGSLLYHFYHIVFIEGDYRYLFQAIFFNFLYLLTAVIGSLSLYIKLAKWDTFKQHILYDEAMKTKLEANKINVDELRKFIPPYEIASSVNKAVSIGLSSISFFLPLLKVLLQR